jgi:hypothetical protein
MIPKIKEWFISQECQALDSSDFYSEKYWTNVDEEIGEDDINILNEHNSTAVENNRSTIDTCEFKRCRKQFCRFPPRWRAFATSSCSVIGDELFQLGNRCLTWK